MKWKKQWREKIKTANKFDERLGVVLRRARNASGLAPDELARLLRIMPDELLAYERGRSDIPLDILERIIVMGYKMIIVRSLERKYRLQRRVFRKIGHTIAQVQ